MVAVALQWEVCGSGGEWGCGGVVECGDEGSGGVSLCSRGDEWDMDGERAIVAGGVSGLCRTQVGATESGGKGKFLDWVLPADGVVRDGMPPGRVYNWWGGWVDRCRVPHERENCKPVGFSSRTSYRMYMCTTNRWITRLR